MRLQLVRTETIEKDGEPVQTLGWLYVYENEELVGTFATLELPWKGNEQNVSCIPPAPGGYKVYRMHILESSNSFDYPHYWIREVPNRTFIKMHRGNFYDQILGCILVGKEHKDIDNDNVKDVTASEDALNELIDLVGEEAELEIKNLA